MSAERARRLDLGPGVAVIGWVVADQIGQRYPSTTEDRPTGARTDRENGPVRRRR